MNTLYKAIVKSVIEDVRKDRKNEEIMLDIENISHREITVYDNLWDEDDPDGRTYTIANPDYMTKDVLRDKLIIPKSATNSPYRVDADILIDWLYQYLPKPMWLTLNRIVLVYDEEADWDELYDHSNIGTLLEIHNLPSDAQLGITWATDDIVVVSVAAIVEGSREMLAIGELYEFELDGCINHGIITTLIHEIRHVAQNNPYLSIDTLQLLDDDYEEDAEQYARRFCDEHQCYVLAA